MLESEIKSAIERKISANEKGHFEGENTTKK